MKNKDLIALEIEIEKCNNLTGVKFAYGLAKNLDIIKKEIEILMSSLKSDNKKYNEYNKRREEVDKRYAKKERGAPVIKVKMTDIGMEKYYDLEFPDKFNKEWDKLKKEYSKVLKERDKQLEDFRELLEEETKVKFFKIKLADVPQNISVEQMKGIMALTE